MRNTASCFEGRLISDDAVIVSVVRVAAAAGGQAELVDKFHRLLNAQTVLSTFPLHFQLQHARSEWRGRECLRMDRCQLPPRCLQQRPL